MSRVIAGTLKKPDGLTTGSGTLTFIASQTSDTVLEGSISTTDVSSTGAYNVTLENGRYLVFFETQGLAKVYLGKITVETSPTTTLNDLLVATSSYITGTLLDYINSAIATAGEDYQAAGAYLSADYDSLDTPTTPTNLAVEIVTNTQQTNPIYSIKATWDASISQSGNLVKYRVSYYTNASETNTIDTTEEYYSIIPALIGETYYIEIRAFAGVNSNRLADGYASATITVTPLGVQAISSATITGASTLKAIVLRWTNPSSVTNPLIHVYSDTVDSFEPAIANRVYMGFAETFTHQVDDIYDRFYKFIVQDQAGTLSSTTGPVGPYSAIRITSTTIGQLMDNAAIQTAQLADGAIIQDKIAARGIAASKIGVMDLTNLVENQNFTEFTDGIFPGWDWGSTEPETPGADGYVTLPANTVLDNDYQFECSEGDKFYGSVKLDWDSACGYADKGFQIVFIDSDGTELNSGYTASNTETSVPADLQLVEGFETAPADTVKGFMRIKTGAVAESIRFTSVICRKGAAVLIEPEGITASKINVADLFALKIQIESGGALYVGNNPGNQILATSPTPGSGLAGIIMGSAQGIQAYDDAGNLTVDIDQATGNAVFSGDLKGSTIGASSVNAGSVVLGQYGSLYTSGKTSYGSAAAGIYLGYSSGYKMDIGSGSAYLRWDGAALGIKGSITATSGFFYGGIEVGTGGKIYSTGKTDYGSATKGFYLEQANNGRLHLGDNTNYLKWTGTALTLGRNNRAAYAVYSSNARNEDLFIAYRGGGTWTYYSVKLIIDTGYDRSVSSISEAGVGLIPEFVLTSVAYIDDDSPYDYIGNGDAMVQYLYPRVQTRTSSAASGSRVYLDVTITWNIQNGVLLGGYSDYLVQITGYTWTLRELS